MNIFTPADLPRLEPDDWGVFWDIWDKHADWLTKVKKSQLRSAEVGINNVWKGFDIYKTQMSVDWLAPYHDISQSLPNMFKLIMSCHPHIYRARFIQSKTAIMPHTDDNTNKWTIRALLHSPAKQSQWFFTQPVPGAKDKTYITMPQDTNWFMYNDRYAWHGSDYDENNEKILLQIYAYSTPQDLLNRSLEKYKNYVIEFAS